MKDKILKILGKYKVIGDTTYGLGYKDADELAEEILSITGNKCLCDERGLCGKHYHEKYLSKI